eukprot:m.121367 g.121367  ORF g.121367 m.121367 type:complete len:405 (-) comp14574_c3_seq1:21-1235(-)
MVDSAKALRVLLVSLEFADPIFSGNGVLARSVARGLLALGHVVLVLSAIPANSSAHVSGQLDTLGITTLAVPVPPDTWGRLDRHSGWEAFEHGAGAHREAIRTFAPDVVVGVDWTGHRAFQGIYGDTDCAAPPFVFLCFRMFTKSVELHKDPSDLAFYTTKERDAVAAARAAVALCRADAVALREHATTPVHVVFPPVRDDIIEALRTEDEMPSKNDATDTSYFLCNARLSPEKNVMLFAEICVRLCTRLEQAHIVPVLAGAVADVEYAARVRATLAKGCPSAIIQDRFLGAVSLLPFYRRSALNFHPALHDAFGLTIVEAAAAGAPSLVAATGHVGAAEFFEADEVLTADYGDPAALSEHVWSLLTNRSHLAAVGTRAATRARGWTTAAYARALETLLYAATR